MYPWQTVVRSRRQQMNRKTDKNDYAVAIFLTGNRKAADELVSEYTAKNALFRFAEDDVVPTCSVKSVYAIDLAASDFIFAGVAASGGVRLRITEYLTDILPDLNGTARGYDETKIAVRAESDDEGITLTYAYYDDELAERFLMDVAAVCAKADARVTAVAAYDPVVADEDALNAVAGLFDAIADPPEPELKFRGYLGAGEMVKLIMRKDVTAGSAGAEAVIDALLSKEKIKWRKKRV